ncbi:hypothetical protein [Dyella sp. 2HG41-7]|uniref:hypothetical protein n=1 Tax=Dyella sp. 2HG41-7 TaxID=2883239 RepID=UPI001F44952B|nr:hypothetical protein [Dyella sp. 2HG41-7]
MSNYFSSASDAASFMSKLLRNDYFQDFSAQDRVEDPDGIYAIEAEMPHWGEMEREAFGLFAEATPAERAELFETWGN